MALHIQDPETDRLTRELNAATGETITPAVNTALRTRLDAVSPHTNGKSKAQYTADIEAIVRDL